MSNASTVISVNATKADLKIEGDPNWDDQQLRINGVIVHQPHISPSGEDAEASVSGWGQDEGNENMMGVMYIAPGGGTFQMTIGQNSDGLMSVTDDYPSEGISIKYSVIAQTKWTVVLKFEDI
jgi:hypothetical protein